MAEGGLSLSVGRIYRNDSVWRICGVVKLDKAMRHGEWLSQWAVGVDTLRLRRELAGTTLGIVGYGHIGQAVAKRAQAFDMTVLATRRSVQDAHPYATVRPCPFDTVADNAISLFARTATRVAVLRGHKGL